MAWHDLLLVSIAQPQHTLHSPILWVPNPNTGIQTAGCDTMPVKGNSVDLREMPGKRSQTSPFRDAPNPRRRIVAARNHNVPFDLQTSHTRLMAYQNILAESALDVPYPQCCVSRARYSGIFIRHLQTAHRGCVPAKCVYALTTFC